MSLYYKANNHMTLNISLVENVTLDLIMKNKFDIFSRYNKLTMLYFNGNFLEIVFYLLLNCSSLVRIREGWSFYLLQD